MSVSTPQVEADRKVDDNGTWLSLKRTMELLPHVHRSQLCEYRNYCALIDGPLVQHKVGRDCWFREELVLLFKERQEERKQGIYRKGDQVCYTAAALIRKGIDHYRRQKLLQEGRLEPVTFPRRHASPKANPDLKSEIVAYRFTQPGDDGTVAPRSFDGTYTRADGRPARNVKAASMWLSLRSCKCHRNDLRRYLRPGGCDYLPGGQLPSELMQRPDRNRMEPTILDDDLERLRQAMLTALKSGQSAGREDGLSTAKDLERHFQLRGRNMKQKLGALLFRLADTDQIERWKTKRISNKKRQWYKPWGYRLDDLLRLLDGRDLRQLLNDLTPWLDRSDTQDFPILAKRSTSEDNKPADKEVQFPRWDEMTSTLFWGDNPIRQFRKHPAQNQRELIEAFHREKWSQTIPNPFGRDARTLNLTIYYLNKSLSPKLIRFSGDGTGEGVMWFSQNTGH
jgi:hypothetical protein